MRLAVVIDCADRMILARQLSVRVLAEDVGELGLRGAFPALWRAATPSAEPGFLTDNGPEFASGVLRELLARLGLTHCRTPRRSPESNGAVEAFFGSLKRDCVVHQGVTTVVSVSLYCLTE